MKISINNQKTLFSFKINAFLFPLRNVVTSQRQVLKKYCITPYSSDILIHTKLFSIFLFLELNLFYLIASKVKNLGCFHSFHRVTQRTYLKNY